jgi:pimeloyl-[acyl-carrier protein] methyl ester esterase
MIIKQSKNGKYPLVLLHGWGVNSGVWDFVLADLEQSFDVFRIDLPGFGLNADVKIDKYDLDFLAEMIAPFCPQNSLLIGWSLGGLVASRIALQYPQKAASLCLIASSPCFAEKIGWKGIKPEVLRQFSTALTQDSQKTIERFLAIQAMGSESVRKDVKWLKQTILSHPQARLEALIGGLVILEETDMRADFQSLKMPIKGIYGQRDTLVAIESVEQLEKSLNNFEYRVIPKASHAPFISHREHFMDNFYALCGRDLGAI